MHCALTPDVVEGLLGPSASLLEGLLAPRLPLGPRATSELLLDVLIHTAGAQGGMLVARDGTSIAAIGLGRDVVGELLGACRTSLPRCLDSAQLVHTGGVATYTSIGLPVAGGTTLLLVTTEGSGHDVDIDAMMAVLPGVTCALNGVAPEWRLAG